MKKKKIIVVGAGQIGQTLANVLSSKGNDITIIEMDETKAKEMASSTDSLVLKGDATKMDIMKDANIEKADVVIAATSDDKTNLMVCQIAKSSEVKKIIARVNDPKNDELFTKLGIRSIVSPVKSVVTDIKKAMYQLGDYRIVSILSGGEVQIVETTVEKDAPFAHIKVSQFDKGIIGSIYRNGKTMIPKNGTQIKPGDVLTIILESKKIDKLSKFKK